MRNNFTFRNQQPDASYAVFTAVAQTKSSRLHSAALRSSPVSSSLHPSHLWRPPKLGILKCNIDASYGSDEGSIACISRDSKGRLTDLFSGRVQARSAFEAEVLALTYTLFSIYSRKDSTMLLWRLNLIVFFLSNHCNERDSRHGLFALCSTKPLLCSPGFLT